jgi:ssDNA-binding Zn-finger/Zn-ribbon topoisomerase 1
MIQTNTPCRECGKPMIGIEFARHFRIVCNNSSCHLFRERQDTIEKQVELAPIETFLPAPLLKMPPPPRGHHVSGKRPRKKTVRRKGLVYDRKGGL